MFNFLKSKPCDKPHFPVTIISNRAPTEQDLCEHGTNWIVRNESQELISFYYRLQKNAEEFEWIKFNREQK